ncbi:hypothetical protein ACWEO2_24995 [Nocardia sp. NPDC004278]
MATFGPRKTYGDKVIPDVIELRTEALGYGALPPGHAGRRGTNGNQG